MNVALQTPFETDHAVVADPAADSDVEWLGQRLGKTGEKAALLLPGLRYLGAGRRAAQLVCALAHPRVGPGLQIGQAAEYAVVGIKVLAAIADRALDLALRPGLTNLAGIDGGSASDRQNAGRSG